MKPLLFFGCTFFLTFTSLHSRSQDRASLDKKADSLYKIKEYRNAGRLRLQSSVVADFRAQRVGSLYNAACSFSLAGDKDSAIFALREAIYAGYNDKKQVLEDKDLEPLHAEKEWGLLVSGIKGNKKVLNDDPAKASLITDDIHHFWDAYDRAQKDTDDRLDIYRKYYFDKASRGMEDYMGLKVRSIKGFVKHHDLHPAFYQAIRRNTLQVDSMKNDIYFCFDRLKLIYPQAKFPDIYFVMGAFTSAGTVSDAGLLIGIDQACKTDDIPVGELNLWQKNNFNPLRNLPGIISHELIHFQQEELLRSTDTTTLFAVEIEGMADFIGELISGKNINQRLHDWAKGKEKKIWEAFKKDMFLNRYGNWIANSDQETPDNPADQGYWIGYQICRAYYINAADKRQAIYDMLHFKDARGFLLKSRWLEMVTAYN